MEKIQCEHKMCLFMQTDPTMMKPLQIKAARVLLGMSQEKFASTAGISPGTVGRLENLKEKKNVTVETLKCVKQAIENHGLLLVADGAIFKQPRNDL